MADKTHFPPGRYQAQVVQQGLSKSSNGNPQFVLSFELQGRVDPSNGELIHCDNYERTIWLTMTQKNIEYVVQDLRELGYTGSSFAALDPLRENYHDLTNLVIQVMCEHDTYQGDEVERWRVYREGRGGGGFTYEPLDSKEVRKLDAMFGKALKEGAVEETIPEPPPAKEPPARDIPF